MQLLWFNKISLVLVKTSSGPFAMLFLTSYVTLGLYAAGRDDIDVSCFSVEVIGTQS